MPEGEARLRQRAHENHIAFHALCAERSGGDIARSAGGLFAAPAHPFAFLNSVCPAGAVKDPGELLDQAERFFADHGREAWSLFTRDTGEDSKLEAATDERGLALVNPHYPQMICAERVDTAAELDPGIEVRPVADDHEIAAYWQLCGEAYATLGFPPDLFEMFAASLLDPPAAGCLAWLDGAPVGGAMEVVTEGVGLIAWVATAPAARGRGVGAAVTGWATNRAFDDGADFASLQASPMGKPVYERLGYRDLFDYRVWRYASDAGQISR